MRNHGAAMMRFGWNVLITVFAAISVSVACAGGVDQIAEDFKPLSGYVVMPRGDEFIIDLDARQGINIGDLFSVIGPGEAVIHPITKKVLGKLEEVKGVLKVTRILDGFSFARPLAKTAGIKEGDPIRRFSGLKAVFWDYTGRNRPLFNQLQKALPGLSWQDYQAAQEARPAQPEPISGAKDILLFIAKADKLEVRDAGLDLIRDYPSEAASLDAGKTAPAPPQVQPPRTSAPPEAAPPAKPKGGIVDFGSAAVAGRLSDNILMADLFHHNGRMLMAATDGKKIDVLAVADGLKPVASAKPGSDGQILAVKWWVPSAGNIYLAVPTWTGQKVASSVFVLENDRLVPVADGLDSILGAFDHDGDGRPETLLGQEFDREVFFGRRIKELFLNNGSFAARTPGFDLPPGFTVIGGQLADLTGDGMPEAVYVRKGILKVYSDKKNLYTSSKQMGGSLSALTYKKDPTLKDYITTSVFFEVSPVAADIDGDGKLELVAVSSDQSAIKAPGLAPIVDKSRLTVFKFQDGGFVRGTLGETVDGAIQGLAVAKGQVLYVASDPGSPFSGGGASRLQALSLK